MSDKDSKAEESKYDEYPLPPPGDDDSQGEDSAEDFPDEGKDLSDQVPDVNVLWLSPPSFNQDPGGGSSGGDDGGNDAPATTSYSIDTGSVRSAEENMLQSSQDAINSYKQLQERVQSAKKGGDDVFGENLKHTESPGSSFAGGTPQGNPQTTSSQFAGDEFAATMNPVQEKVLAEIGGLLETTGEYIAMINRAGQGFAQADRESQFPEPPPRG